MSSQQSAVAIPDSNTEESLEAQRQTSTEGRRKKQPRYKVILWDDPDHSFEYVIRMMKELFHHPIEKGFQIAKRVDSSGQAICMVTTMELAELKRDQVRAYGKDELVARCSGSMRCTIEPVTQE
ncbi:MAG: ATP-dependent Clp protease adaptor ClpS [Planctomycetota bacterium]